MAGDKLLYSIDSVKAKNSPESVGTFSNVKSGFFSGEPAL